MRRLAQTKLFLLLNGTESIFNPTETDLQPVYDNFVHSVVGLCTSLEVEIPAYFTLHYARLELQGYRSVINQEAGKKCADHRLHRQMLVLY